MTLKDLNSYKSQQSKVSENVAVETIAQKDILNQSKNVAVKILMLRYSLVFILVGLATGLGGGSFVILRYKELSTFRDEFNSAAIQTKRSLTDHIFQSYVAAALISSVYTGQMNTTEGVVWPNYTMPGFDNIVSGINQLSKSRITSLSPLLKNTSRLAWEQYAKDNVGALHGPASLRISTNGSRIVADGIFTTDSRGKQCKSPTTVPESQYPHLLFPIWQVAPLQANAVAVMFDPHAKLGTRMFAIDRAISTKQGASTDIVQLVIDSSKYRPSTILYFPVATPGKSLDMMGLIGMAFTWDEIFAHVLPSYLNRVDCVVSTVTTSFTIALVNGAVKIVGREDLHDRKFDAYATVISEGLSDSSTSLAGYTVTIYPTHDMYSTYITSYPQNVCIGAVTIIVFTALVFTLYVYLVTIRQAQLEEVATRSLVMNSSRDAVLQSKKIYVRYISHEMRTPLNVAFLGLKLLIKDLSEDPRNYDRVETVNDISKACNMALSILNDLLNYDKLEDGTLLIEPKKMVALPFILKSTEVLNLQVKEKGLILTFDLDDPSPSASLNTGVNAEGCNIKHYGVSNESPWGVSSCLSSSDFISVDPHKMNQVIGNLVSNAIKFTPAGQGIIVKARKVVPNTFNGASTRSTSAAGKAGSNRAPSRMLLLFRRLHSTLFRRTSVLTTDVDTTTRARVGPRTEKQRRPLTATTSSTNSNSSNNSSYSSSTSSGHLVLEVIDSGVGMAPEDSMRLFKEIVQFNPSKLQAGGGSGLGMMITKGIVDLHGGEISVYSAGEGQGSTFTLKIPLLNKAHQAQAQEEVDADMRSSALLAHGPPPRLTQLLNNVASSQAHSQTHSFEGTQSTLLIEDTDRDWDRVGDHTAIPIGTEDLLFALQREDTEDSVCCYESSTFIPETSAIDPHPDPVHFKCMQLCIPMHAAAAPPPSPETPVVDLSHQRFKILVVDDSKLNRKMLVKSLKTERHSCDEAEDGLEAVRMVTKMSESKTDESSSLSCPYSYDAILMDFMMPIMDGPTATKALRDMGYTGVIIGVTGNALPSDVAYFTGKGADKVLIKPVDVDVLLLTVHALLGASRADRTDLVWTTGK